MEKYPVRENIQTLLHHTMHLQASYRQAKQRYARQIAPDFRLFSFFRINENTLSRCLAFLLDPEQNHAQGELFLSHFYRLIDKNRSVVAKNKTQVYTEYTITDGRRIDILITDENELIGIENKPWASDQKNQLYDYALWLSAQAQRKHAGWSLIYLCNNEITDFTLHRDTPEEIKNQIKTITFYQLESWLSECAIYIKAAPVRCYVDALIQFIREEINGENNMDLQIELTKNVVASPQNLSAAFLIAQNMRQVKEHLWIDFIDYLNEQLAPSGASVEMNEGLVSGRKYAGFSVHFNPGDSFTLSWEFEGSDYRHLAYGICTHEAPDGEIQKSHYSRIDEAMRSIFPTMNTQESSEEGWWPWWCYAEEMNAPRNWSMDPTAWVLLIERHDASFAQTIINMATRISQELDPRLLKIQS